MELINYRNAEVISTNYSSLLEAMGKDMYGVYMWGKEGLRTVPKLYKSLRESNLNARLTCAEYRTKDSDIVQHLFIEKRLENGTRVIYVVDVEGSEPFLYRLDNLFCIDLNGQVVDLLEEVGEEVRSYFIPSSNSGFHADPEILLFGDIDRMSKRLGMRVGIEIYLHEIGHYKHFLLNRNLLLEFSNPLNWRKLLYYPSKTINKVLQAVQNNSPETIREILFPVRKEAIGILNYIIDTVIVCEEAATAYARLWLVQKREKGMDYLPDRTGVDLGRVLEAAFITYEWRYMRGIINLATKIAIGKERATRAYKPLTNAERIVELKTLRVIARILRNKLQKLSLIPEMGVIAA